MTEIIGFCNRKGGVGKTTTAINLAASLAVAERKVLLIDLDPQCNTTTGIGFNKKSINSNSYSTILSGEPPEVQRTPLPFLDLLPSTPDLVGAEVELVEEERREFRLRDGITPLLDRYEFILIDGPPSLGLLTVNLLAASTEVLIPVQCEYYALEGLSDLLETIGVIREEVNPSLEICGILLTMFDPRNNLAHEVEGEIRQHFKEKVFQTVIPRSIRLSEAPSHGKPAILYDFKSRGAESYMRLAQEFLERMKKRGGQRWSEERLVGGLPR